MSTFNLRERAEELFPIGMPWERSQSIQLATEALEAAAKECESYEPPREGERRSALIEAASIIRRIARPSPAEAGVADSPKTSPGTVYDEELRDERARQDAKWGGPAHDDTHTPKDWLRFISDHWYEARSAHIDSAHPEYRRELLAIEALARAARESFDRVRGAAAWRRAADTLDGMGQPYERATMSHEKPGATDVGGTDLPSIAPNQRQGGSCSNPSMPREGKGERQGNKRNSADPSSPPAPLSDADALVRPSEMGKARK